MDENVLGHPLLLDEAVPLLVVEPLDGACRHSPLPPKTAPVRNPSYERRVYPPPEVGQVFSIFGTRPVHFARTWTHRIAMPRFFVTRRKSEPPSWRFAKAASGSLNVATAHWPESVKKKGSAARRVRSVSPFPGAAASYSSATCPGPLSRIDSWTS